VDKSLEIAIGGSYLCRNGLSIRRIVSRTGVPQSKTEAFWCHTNNQYDRHGKIKHFSDENHPLDLIAISK
jgi:hypothetical protein